MGKKKAEGAVSLKDTKKIDQPAPVEVIDAPAPVEVIDAPAPDEVIDAPAPVEVIDAPAPVEVIDAPAPDEVIDAPAPDGEVDTPSSEEEDDVNADLLKTFFEQYPHQDAVYLTSDRQLFFKSNRQYAVEHELTLTKGEPQLIQR